ncbi:hypothetical protein KVV02_000725 [Mortierella alpina]|uniref:Uncharacterized protein n=1 Tax=Mortierella alpina TaxID=64518 RepID=A0A9P7ZYD8_MORAP|nr:hypothetical protein KVV02_000725 [Mortierella alpina]
MSAPDGPRLVIGTQSCNVLVTSSLRLDTLGMGSVGGSTTSFQLNTADDSKAVKIFLDLESVESAFDLARNKDAWTVSRRNILCQLRQLRSKFHDASTYFLCRASGYTTRHHVSQPYSVFTLINFDQSRPGSGAAAGSIFKTIAIRIIKEGENAKLYLSTLKECRGQCGDTKIASILDAMIGLFSPETDSIPIIGNCQLNTQLEILAGHMSSFLATANKSALAQVEHSFTHTSVAHP